MSLLFSLEPVLLFSFTGNNHTHTGAWGGAWGRGLPCISAQAHNIWAAYLSKHTDIHAHVHFGPASQGPRERVWVKLPLCAHFWELEGPAEYVTNT